MKIWELLVLNLWWGAVMFVVAFFEFRLGMKIGRRTGYREGWRHGFDDADKVSAQVGVEVQTLKEELAYATAALGIPSIRAKDGGN